MIASGDIMISTGKNLTAWQRIEILDPEGYLVRLKNTITKETKYVNQSKLQKWYKKEIGQQLELFKEEKKQSILTKHIKQTNV